MPKCIVCQRAIRAKEPRSYARIKGRKRYGCTGCSEAFDKLLDSLCPACGGSEYYENHSNGFVWMECDDCGHKQVVKSPGESA